MAKAVDCSCVCPPSSLLPPPPTSSIPPPLSTSSHLLPGPHHKLPCLEEGGTLPWELPLWVTFPGTRESTRTLLGEQVQPCTYLATYIASLSDRVQLTAATLFSILGRLEGGLGDVCGSSWPTVVRLWAWDSPPASRLPSGLELQQEGQGLLLWGSWT